ncbi:unnamed protein product [Symbiodinium microadriaticum]|nr:unnamed protein product [Symbiodinium microadriaticum]
MDTMEELASICSSKRETFQDLEIDEEVLRWMGIVKSLAARILDAECVLEDARNEHRAAQARLDDMVHDRLLEQRQQLKRKSGGGGEPSNVKKPSSGKASMDKGDAAVRPESERQSNCFMSADADASSSDEQWNAFSFLMSAVQVVLPSDRGERDELFVSNIVEWDDLILQVSDKRYLWLFGGSLPSAWWIYSEPLNLCQIGLSAGFIMPIPPGALTPSQRQAAKVVVSRLPAQCMLEMQCVDNALLCKGCCWPVVAASMIAVALSEVHRTAVTALLVAHIQLSRLHCLPTMAAVAEQPIVPQGQAAMAEQPIVPQGRQEESERKRKQREYESRRPKRTRANQTKVDEMATKLNEKTAEVDSLKERLESARQAQYQVGVLTRAMEKLEEQQEHAADKQKLQEVVNTLQEKLHFASVRAPDWTGEGLQLDTGDCALDGAAWQPGIDVGLGMQAQVLLCNVYLGLKKLPKQLVNQIITTLPPIRAVRPLISHAAAALLRISGNTINNIVQSVQSNAWAPRDVVPHGRQVECEEEVQPSTRPGQRNKEEILKVLVREALHSSAHGLADDSFLQAVARLTLCGVDTGDKFCSRPFLRLCEFLGAKLLELCDAETMAEKLPGIGVVPPVSIAFDSVSVGDSMYARAETFQILVLSCISPHTGVLGAHFLSCPSSGLAHDGKSQCRLVLHALEQHAARLTKASLQSRIVCMIGGDGGSVRGGVDQRHSSTSAGNYVAAELCPDSEEGQWAEWEGFHRSEAAFRRAIATSEFTKEVYAVARAMSQNFGFGAGRVLLRSVSSLAESQVPGEQSTPACDVGGTRRGIAMQRVASNTLANFRKYALGLHARLHRRKQGRGAGTQTSLVSLGRRLLSPDFVTYCCTFADLMGHQKPFTLSVQSEGGAPWTRWEHYQQKQQASRNDVQNFAVID